MRKVGNDSSPLPAIFFLLNLLFVSYTFVLVFGMMIITKICIGICNWFIFVFVFTIISISLLPGITVGFVFAFVFVIVFVFTARFKFPLAKNCSEICSGIYINICNYICICIYNYVPLTKNCSGICNGICKSLVWVSALWVHQNFKMMTMIMTMLILMTMMLVLIYLHSVQYAIKLNFLKEKKRCFWLFHWCMWQHCCCSGANLKSHSRLCSLDPWTFSFRTKRMENQILCATRVWAWESFAKLHLKLHCFAFAHCSFFHILGERELDQTFKSGFLQTFKAGFLQSFKTGFLLEIQSEFSPWRVFASHSGFYFSVI